MPSTCSLVNENEQYQIDTLYPAGGFTIMPGEAQACYSYLEEELYLKYQWIVFEDNQGKAYRAPLPAPSQ